MNRAEEWISALESGARAWTGKSLAERTADAEFEQRMARRRRFEASVIRREDELGVGARRWAGGAGLDKRTLARLWRQAGGA